MNILVTGASGFIGSNFIKYTNHRIKRVVRNKASQTHFENSFYISDFSSNTDWDEAFKNVDVVLHLGALVHKKPKIFSQSYFNHILEANSFATSRFVREASLHGVRRFIFLSTIGVYGQFNNEPLTEIDLTFPYEPYSISKLIAEGCIQNICASSSMDYVIIRSPMVYGPNAPGNFKRLVKLIKYGFPLPISTIKNKRSFVGINNLIDFIDVCISAKNASNEIFLVSDNQDVSTFEFASMIAFSIKKKLRTYHIPSFLISDKHKLIGVYNYMNKITQNLQADISKSSNLLNWKPRVSIQKQLTNIFT